MNFQHKFPEWKNKGKEPSETLKNNGFAPKYKPPASFFNWFWSKVMSAITELQTNVQAELPVTGYYKPTDSGVYEKIEEDGYAYHYNHFFNNLGYIPKAIFITSSGGEFFSFISPNENGTQVGSTPTPFVNNFNNNSGSGNVYAITNELGITFVGCQITEKGLENAVTSQYVAADQDKPRTTYYYIIIK